MKQDIYAKPSVGVFYSPFSVNIDSMEHLILINFEKDPDEIYNVFELQQACDNGGRKKYLVIAYRNDGDADVFHQPEFPFASQASILNGTDFIESSLENVKFEINDDRLEVFFAFTDKLGRRIKAKVLEDRRQKNKPFFLLAPVGVISKNPVSLPVYSLYNMSFTKQKHTDIEVEIDNIKHKSDTFPIPIDCSKNFLTRYSADTFNVDWNKNYNGPLLPLMPVKNEAEANSITYELADNNGHYEIKRMISKNKNHRICFDLYPPMPDIACLSDKVHINGNFIITTDNSTGNLRGEYSMDKHENEIDLQFQPNYGWEPNEKRWILKFLFMIVKVFKEWPKTYVWKARIQLNGVDSLIMKSKWERI